MNAARVCPPGDGRLSYAPVELIVLGSGSSGNSAILRGSGTTLLLDAGLSAKKTLARLAAAGISPDDIDAVLLTHEHSDHAGGLPVLLRSLRCPLYATRLTAGELRDHDPRLAAAEWRLFATGGSFEIRTLEITAFSVPHDAADPVGFAIRGTSTSIGVITDLGHVNHSVVHHVAGVNCLFVEANHDEQMLQADTRRPFATKQRILSPHGHLSNRAAGDLARQILGSALSHIVLGHLSRDCNTPALARSAVESALEGAPASVLCAEQDVALAPVLFGA